MKLHRQYLQRLGIVNTQYSIVKHMDKSHTHLHIVTNMVDNDEREAVRYNI
jgi:hypothetical protein